MSSNSWSDQGYGAFPCGDQTGQEPKGGMTMRDWFAGQALGGLIVGYAEATGRPTYRSDEVVEAAYSYADAMLAKRAQ